MKLPQSFYNRTSITGSLLVIASLSIIIFLYILSSIFETSNAYIGLFIYIVFPGLLILGLVLIPIGMVKKNKRLKKGIDKEKRRLVIDLNNRRQRTAVLIFSIGTILFIFLTGIGSYKAYHYSDSVEFCGTMCHKVMKPEYTTYQNSPHARVSCTECHVGSGASWFVKSKLSGLYQVYATLANKYPRPIPTPISDLRPARETCEECHWPQKFYAPKLVHEKHYLSDSLNSEWNIHLRIKTSPEHSSLGIQEGIHWHNHPDVRIEYIPTTQDREYIGWIRYINLASGDTLIYEDTMMPLDEAMKDTIEVRTMDCMDCHTRPSHNFLFPSDFIDENISKGLIPRSLPEIKLLSMEIFNTSFTSTDTAMMYIESSVTRFYEENYPDIAANNSELIQKAVAGIQDGFLHNVFPEMQADWHDYLDHIGHVEFNGCFRCHDEMHETAEGKSISKDCNMCHTIQMQGLGDNLEIAAFNGYLEFKHPVDIDGMWQEVLCSECHNDLY